MTDPFRAILAERSSDDAFVRRALAALETEFREMALLALADWARLEIPRPEIYPAIVAIQEPSWGSWNGLLAALRTVRNAAFQDPSPDLRARVREATTLEAILECLEARVDEGTLESLRDLGELASTKLRRARIAGLLALPIALRNRVVHDNPTDPAWWRRAAAGLAALLEYHARERPCRPGLEDPPDWPEPWFQVRGGEVWGFAGFSRDFAIRFLSPLGECRLDPEASAGLLERFKSLLGRREAEIEGFKLLLSRAAPQDLKGVVIDDFLVGVPVGKGGFATVHGGLQLSTGRRVAIKILADELREEFGPRFQQEAVFLSRFNHANIVGVFGHGEEPWTPSRVASPAAEPWFQERFARSSPTKAYIALEWIDGRTLDDVFSLPDPPAVHRVTHWFRQAAGALAVVHANGLVHRDVKPSNLMVTEDGVVKLMDFGIAASQAQQRTLVTTTGRVFGTPAYMSPEQLAAADAEAEVGAATDVYSLCATFYELYTRTRLYRHDTTDGATVARLKRSGIAPERPRRLFRALPWELETILMGGLEKEAADRHRSMADLEQDLARFLQDEPIRYRKPSLVRRARLAYRRNRTVAHLVLAFVAAAVAGVVLYVRDVTAQKAAATHEWQRAEEESARARQAEEEAQRKRREAERSLAEAQIFRATEHILAGEADRALAQAAAARAIDDTPRARTMAAFADTMSRLRLVRATTFIAEGRPGWANDGRTLVLPQGRGKYRIVGVEDGTATDREIPGTASFSMDLMWVATVLESRTLEIRPLSGEGVSRFRTEGRTPLWAPDGQRLAVLGESCVEIYEPRQETWARTDEGRLARGATKGEFSPDGAFLLTAESLIDLRRMETVWEPPGTHAIACGRDLFAYQSNPDGILHVRLLASPSADRPEDDVRGLDPCTGIAFGSGDRYLAASTRGGSIHVWDLSKKELATVAGGFLPYLPEVLGMTSIENDLFLDVSTQVPPDARIEIGGKWTKLWPSPREVRRYRLPRPEERIHEWKHDELRSIADLRFSPDGSLLVVQLGDLQAVEVLEVPGGRMVHRFELLEPWRDTPPRFALSRDGRYVAWVEGDRSLQIATTAPGEPCCRIDPQTPQGGPAIDFHPETGFLTSVEAGHVRVWDPRSGERVQEWNPASLGTDLGSPGRIRWSPDGQLLAVQEHRSLRLVDLDGRRVTTLLDGAFPQGQNCLAWLDEGRVLAVGLTGGNVLGFDRTGQVVAHWGTLSHHVTDVAELDRERLVARADGPPVIFDRESGEVIGTVPSDPRTAGLAVDPAGRWIAIAPSGSGIQIVPISPILRGEEPEAALRRVENETRLHAEGLETRVELRPTFFVEGLIGLLEQTGLARDREEAARVAAEAGDAETVASAALTLYRLGDFEGALDAFDRAIALAGGTSRLAWGRALALSHLGRMAEARTSALEAMGADPDLMPLAWILRNPSMLLKLKEAGGHRTFEQVVAVLFSNAASSILAEYEACMRLVRACVGDDAPVEARSALSGAAETPLPAIPHLPMDRGR